MPQYELPGNRALLTMDPEIWGSLEIYAGVLQSFIMETPHFAVLPFIYSGSPTIQLQWVVLGSYIVGIRREGIVKGR